MWMQFADRAPTQGSLAGPKRGDIEQLPREAWLAGCRHSVFHLHIQCYEKPRDHIEGGAYDQLNHVPIAGQRLAERRKGSIADVNIASHLEGDPNRRAFFCAKQRLIVTGCFRCAQSLDLLRRATGVDELGRMLLESVHRAIQL